MEDKQSRLADEWWNQLSPEDKKKIYWNYRKILEQNKTGESNESIRSFKLEK